MAKNVADMMTKDWFNGFSHLKDIYPAKDSQKIKLRVGRIWSVTSNDANGPHLIAINMILMDELSDKIQASPYRCDLVARRPGIMILPCLQRIQACCDTSILQYMSLVYLLAIRSCNSLSRRETVLERDWRLGCKMKAKRVAGIWHISKLQDLRSWVSSKTINYCSLLEGDDGDVSRRVDGLLWYKDLGNRLYGEFSMAVVQANRTSIGVYDGHGGFEASQFVGDNLFCNLKSEDQSMSEDVIKKAFSAKYVLALVKHRVSVNSWIP
ncbi:hypothetical protein L6164_016815 [Bauhinia variegata]|uniref:Uncharacterized protein n=1 Tax=Bauhinia variegata TaxID=167791 RepID=A0ACB9N7H9_BAUVA|nr:hypothetical protein L6164_016815 [Bauhinia variegata]